MALSKQKKTETKKTEVKNHAIFVRRAHELDNGTIMFDMEVNGVMIYGCSYRTLTRKDNGEEFAKIGFPSHQGKDGKWYNHCFVQLTEDDITTIEEGIENLED